MTDLSSPLRVTLGALIHDLANKYGDRPAITDVMTDETLSYAEFDRFINRIAHGFLTLSLLASQDLQISAVKSVTRGINYGSNKVRFTNMVPVDSRIRLRNTLKSAEPKAGGTLFTSEVKIEVEGQEMPALVAESLTILFE